ncbi:MAG: hypothetical protein V3T61_03490, partial [Acidobacteriota bacterium]
DLDRSKDVNHGLIDRVCNPRPAFHVVRCMNTILFAPGVDYTPFEAWREDRDGIGIRTLRGSDQIFSLLLPDTKMTRCTESVLQNALHGLGEDSLVRLYRLAEATVATVKVRQLSRNLAVEGIAGPILLTAPG